ncbi:MAG TPA: GNAT family N-acetyltransferase [Xanthomonadales bacterium]
METPGLIIRQMQRQELDVLVDWAAAEGWNPGLGDADIFWATDPEGFIAAELDGQLVGGGSIVSYGGRFGFMGFFIIHPEHRGRGLGNTLWHSRLHRLLARLETPAVIGMDGVFVMQDYYAKGGFEFAARDLRFEVIARSFPKPEHVEELARIGFATIDAYDRAHFPAPRSEFLRRWISQPGAHALGTVREGRLAGYGVMRPCRKGYKIGPLFADSAEVAENLFRALSTRVPGEVIYTDMPENNQSAMSLAQRHGMKEVFGCAKMYLGPKPVLPEAEIFAVTTFELG